MLNIYTLLSTSFVWLCQVNMPNGIMHYNASDTLCVILGVIPEYVAKWISGHGIPPSFLCLSSVESETETTKSVDSPTANRSETNKQNVRLLHTKSRSLSLSGNPIIS